MGSLVSLISFNENNELNEHNELNEIVTPFAIKVYKVVLSIPLGEVRTYKQVAKKAGSPKAYRAVGRILKNNPYPLIIPCHRVVAGNHKLGGYAWGKKNKKAILNLERQIKKLML